MKTVLSMLAMVLLVSSLAFSQGGQSASTFSTFDVGFPLFVSALPGNFGTLAPGTAYTISADGNISPADVLGSTTEIPIEWDITGQAGANVLVTFSLPGFFTATAGTGARVPYSVTVQSAGWSSIPFVPGSPYNPIDPRVPNTMTLDALSGGATVQLGGVLTVPVSASGNYEAQFVLTAAYTGL